MVLFHLELRGPKDSNATRIKSVALIAKELQRQKDRSIFNSPTVLEVSHCELLSRVSTKALVNIRYLTINTQSNRVAIVSSVITRIFLTLCNAGRSHLNLFQ
jgi:hypothetical protein